MSETNSRYSVFGKGGDQKIIWYFDDIGKYHPSISEINEAVNEKFQNINLEKIKLEYECGVVCSLCEDENFENVKYQIIPSNSGRKSIVWYFNVLKNTRKGFVFLSELNEAVSKEFPNFNQENLLFWKYDCGLVIRQK